MIVKLTKNFSFEASHRLDHLPQDHACYNLHGHSYRVRVEVTGEVNEKTGFLLDYADLKKIIKPVIKQLDHKHLNDVAGLEITSTEHICRWLWERLKPNLPILSKITIFETDSTSCEYTGQ